MKTIVGKEKEIERLYKKKYSIGRIAKELDVTTAAISMKLERMGLRERIHADRLTDIEKREIVEQYQAGVRSGELAKKYDVHQTTIRDAVRKAGAMVFGRGNRFRDFTPNEKALANQMWSEGRSQTVIATRLSSNQVAVSRLLRSLGLRPVRRKAEGARHGQWKGGRQVVGGYMLVLLPIEHPLRSMANSHGYVLEHRLVMAESLGRPLLSHESVHHIDGDKTNNKLENLQLRQGKHGTGVVHRRLDCGSNNVEAVKL